ncbi:MAG: Gfo/Idh/MocA family protein [Planctomycetota bacterium]
MSRSSTRREFLSAAGLAAAGYAVPCFIGNAAAQQAKQKKAGQPKPKAPPAPTLEGDWKIGAIGVGGRGSGIANGAARFGQMVACCDVDREHAERFAAKFSDKCQIYANYRELLDRSDINVVTIGTPDHWHTAIAIAAMRAGKDVYCEKPLTLTIDEGKQLCRVVQETGRVFQVGTQQRSEYNQMFLKAVALTRSGRLGKKLTITCGIGGARAGGPFPTSEPPAGLDWDLWLGQAPVVPYSKERCHGTFRWWLEYSGGKLTDWGAHHVDIAQWALGYEKSGPVEIEGQGDFPGLPSDFNPVDFFAGKQKLENCYNTATDFRITLRFANGNQIIVTNEGDNGALIEGEKGRIFVSRKKLVGKPIEELTAADEEWLDGEVRKLYRGKPLHGHMYNFFDCVRDRSLPISDVFTNHRGISSCHMCNIAMLLKRKLRWDAVKEDFVGDAEASALIARPQRAPYVIPS